MFDHATQSVQGLRFQERLMILRDREHYTCPEIFLEGGGSSPPGALEASSLTV